MSIETKRCAACGEHLPLDSFRQSLKSRDGLRPQCKLCQREQSRRWYLNNKNVADERRRNRREVRTGQRVKRRAWGERRAMPEVDPAVQLGLYPCSTCPGFFRLGDMKAHLELHELRGRR